MKSDEAVNSFSSSESEDFHPYRAVSKAAVLALMLSAAGVLGLMFPVMLLLPLLGGLFAMQALHALNKFPDELTGRGIAIAGGLLSFVILVGGVSYHTYVYLTEVPDGYDRITFSQLQPQKRNQVLPPNIDALNRKKVFLKGYMHPSGTQGQGEVREFILVPDMGTCCFGGQPKLTDMVQVRLQGNLTTRYNRVKKKLAGIFKVDQELKPVSGLDGVYYQMDANYVRN